MRGLWLVPLLVTVGAAALPLAGHSTTPTTTEERGCLVGVASAEGVGHSLMELREASSLYRAVNRTVDLDDRMTFSVIALATALGETVDVASISNHSLDRIEVCAFARAANATREDAVVGSLTDEWSRADLGEERLLAVFRTTLRQNVTLDPRIALNAIALHASGGVVRLADVISLRHEERTVKEFERNATRSEEQALLDLVLSREHR